MLLPSQSSSLIAWSHFPKQLEHGTLSQFLSPKGKIYYGKCHNSAILAYPLPQAPAFLSFANIFLFATFRHFIP